MNINRVFAVSAAIVVARALHAQQVDAIGATLYTIRQPVSLIGLEIDQVNEVLGAEANGSTKQSNFSLNLLYAKPLEQEAVWTFNLEDSMSLVFEGTHWSGDSARTKRWSRMYYHVGFNAEGKVVAAAMWFGCANPFITPDIAAPDPLGSKRVRRARYWSHHMLTTVSWKERGNKMKMSYWPTPVREEFAWYGPGRMEGDYGWPVRDSNGKYGSVGWAMAEGHTLGKIPFLVAGRCFPAHGLPGITTNSYALPFTKVAVSDLVLAAAFSPDTRPDRTEIIPALDSRSVYPVGVQ